MAAGACLLLLASAVTALWVRAELRASLPILEGALHLAGLAAPVEVHRDGLGIPRIIGTTRQDVAAATGFLHAQERFFQMDLTRRRPAGELAALVGTGAVGADHQVRIHRFRSIAQQAVSLLEPTERALVDAYVAGVNAGLAALASPPFEYRLLDQQPAPWLAEDCLLVVLSMYVTLQDIDGRFESTLGTLHDLLPPEVFEFLVPRGTNWDAPVAGGAFGTPPVPGPEMFDPRTQIAASVRPFNRARTGKGEPDDFWGRRAAEVAIGSNNWAVSAQLTGAGPMIANDMHLDLRVPNTWYRAELQWNNLQAPAEPHRLTGLTLPGLPSLVTGSNGRVAWGFTNAYADWSDVVLLEVDDAQPDRYRAPDGWRAFEHHTETIEVAGEDPVRVDVPWTIWGPVLEPDYRGRARAFRWVAHSAARLAALVLPLESARTMEEAFADAHAVGAPGQNLVVADRDGHIGWTIYGAIPRRIGDVGRWPVSWADGRVGWDGWLASDEVPRIVDPEDGRIWTANARVVDAGMLERLGDGNYDVGARASIIRDRLRSRDHFTPPDMLALQLDSTAAFLERWRCLLLDALTDEAVAARGRRAALRTVVDETWTGEASPDSVAYRLVREFREAVSDRVFSFALGDVMAADPNFRYSAIRVREGALWALVSERPIHWLEPGVGSWDDLLLEVADGVVDRAMADESDTLTNWTWANANPTRVRHPLSAAVPLLGRWLDMPETPLPGDLYTPRQQYRGIGASVRMVVSPGREDEGLMHMPTGQSGHPLSPFYGNSHESWVRGEPTPLRPGPVAYRLTLTP